LFDPAVFFGKILRTINDAERPASLDRGCSRDSGFSRREKKKIENCWNLSLSR